MNELEVPLEEILPCFRGVNPSTIATCSAEGVPNITVLSIVRYVDSERVGLSRQFFNKTRANLEANPSAQILVVHPETYEQFALDTRFLHTETEGPTFEGMKANLDAVASQMNMTDVFRLRGVDIHRVLSCSRFGPAGRSAPAHRRTNELASLDEFVRRLSLCSEYGAATRAGLEALDDLFGFRQSILLVADQPHERLLAIASYGYPTSAAGTEVAFGEGVIGVAAERRRVVCVPSTVRTRAMRTAVEESMQRDAEAPRPEAEVGLPGLERAESVAAIPLIVRGELTGLLYLESDRQGEFGPGDERLLRTLGGQLAATLALLQPDQIDAHAPRAPDADAMAVAYYQADDSVFVDGEHLVKGVPGRILWKLLGEHAVDGRALFTNRELRLDESLRLPAGNDNLEARLLVLRKRLKERDCGIQLTRVGRGQLELAVARPLSLSEVPTTGPMGAQNEPQDGD
jgi:adenylate cyclase